MEAALVNWMSTYWRANQFLAARFGQGNEIKATPGTLHRYQSHKQATWVWVYFVSVLWPVLPIELLSMQHFDWLPHAVNGENALPRSLPSIILLVSSHHHNVFLGGCHFSFAEKKKGGNLFVQILIHCVLWIRKVTASPIHLLIFLKLFDIKLRSSWWQNC